MFVTDPSFEHYVPPGLGAPPNARHWVAATLSLGTPWYLLTWGTSRYGSQTVLVAWETVLISLIEQIRAKQFKSLRVLFVDPATRGWSMRPVHEVWLPAEDESDGKLLLMRLAGRDRLVDSYMHEVADWPGRLRLAVTLEFHEAPAAE